MPDIETQLSTAIGAIYDAVPSRELPHTALAGAAGLFRAKIATVDILNCDGMMDGPVLNADRALWDVANDMKEHNLLPTIIPQLQVGGAISLHNLCTLEQMLSSPIYHEILNKIGVLHNIHLTFYKGVGEYGGITFWRSLGEEPAGAAEMRLANIISDHLARAFRVGLQLRRAGALDSVSKVVEDLGAPCAFVDAKGRLLRINLAAKALVESSGAFRIAGGHLLPNERKAARTWKIILGRLDPRYGPPCGIVARLEGRWGALLIRSLPLGSEAAELWGIIPDTVPVGLLLLDSSARRTKSRGEVLRTVFGLTKAEAALALAILEGESLADYANRLGRTHQTARFHLKNVSAKIGCRRQSELVRQLSSIVFAEPDRTRQ